MEDFRKRAELTRLSRLLQQPRESLHFLEKLDIPALRQLRRHVSDYHHAARRELFRRLAQYGRLVPPAWAAWFIARLMPPRLCARLTSEIPARRVLPIAMRLPTPYLADICTELDTVRNQELVSIMPVPHVLRMAHELLARNDYLTIANFVDAVSTEGIHAVVGTLEDGEALLQIGFFVENPQRLEEIMQFLRPAQIDAIIAAAANPRLDLWAQALALMDTVSLPWQEHLINLAGGGDEQVLASMLEAVIRMDCWAQTLPLIAHMNKTNQTRLVNLPLIQQDTVLRAILQAVASQDLWSQLLGLADLMDTPSRRRLARLSDELSDATIQRVVQVAHEQNCWPGLLRIVPDMSLVRCGSIADLIGQSADSELDSLVAAVQAEHYWHVILPLTELMSDSARRRVANWPAIHQPAVLRLILDTTRDFHLWGLMLPLVKVMDAEGRRRVARLSDELDDASIAEIVQVAHDQRLWLAALPLIEGMGTVRRGTIAELMAQSADAEFSSLLHAVTAGGYWPQVLPLIALLSPDSQRRIVNLPVFHREATLRAILAASDEHGLWSVLLPQLALVEPGLPSPLAQLAAELDDATVRRVLAVAAQQNLWLPLLQLMEGMPATRRQALALLVSESPESVVTCLLRSVQAAGAWPRLLARVAELPETSQRSQRHGRHRSTTAAGSARSRARVLPPPVAGIARRDTGALESADVVLRTLALAVFNRGFVGPALEGAVEGARLGKTGQVDNLLDGFAGARQQAARQARAIVGQHEVEARIALGQLRAQPPWRHVQALRHRLQTGVAAFQHFPDSPLHFRHQIKARQLGEFFIGHLLVQAQQARLGVPDLVVEDVAPEIQAVFATAQRYRAPVDTLILRQWRTFDMAEAHLQWLEMIVGDKTEKTDDAHHERLGKVPLLLGIDKILQIGHVTINYQT